MKYVIKQEQLQKLADYLVSRPFIEVFVFIDMLNHLPKLEDKKEVSDKR